MTDFNKPQNTAPYASGTASSDKPVLEQLRDNITSCITLNSINADNKPVGALNVSFGTSFATFSRWNGTVFQPLSDFKTNLDAAKLDGNPPSFYRSANNLNSGKLSFDRLPDQLNPPALSNTQRVWSEYVIQEVGDTELVLPSSFFNSSNEGVFQSVLKTNQFGDYAWSALDDYLGSNARAIRVKVVFSTNTPDGRLYARHKDSNSAADFSTMIAACSNHDIQTTPVGGVGEVTLPLTGTRGGFSLAWRDYGSFAGGAFARLYLTAVYT